MDIQERQLTSCKLPGKRSIPNAREPITMFLKMAMLGAGLLDTPIASALPSMNLTWRREILNLHFTTDLPLETNMFNLDLTKKHAGLQGTLRFPRS